MNVLVVRPIIIPFIRAIQSTGNTAYGVCIWDAMQGPNLTKEVVAANADINWAEWQPENKALVAFYKKTKFFVNLYSQYQVDIVHLNGLRDLVSCYVARWFSKTKPKLVIMSHNPQIWSSDRKTKLLTVFLRLFSDGCVTLATTHAQKLIANGYNPDIIQLLPNPFMQESDTPAIKEKSDVFEFVCVASIIPRKNQFMLVQAFSNLTKTHPNIRLTLIGDYNPNSPYVSEIMSFLEAKDLTSKVTLTGKLPHSEVLQIVQTSDLVVFPTKAEMMPRAIIEAMWSGVPVVASGVDGILDLITDGETGWLCAPDDVDQLTRKMEYCLQHPEELSRVGENGQRFVKDFCSIESVGKETISFYNRILNGGGIANEER